MKRKPNPPRRCIFCHGGPISREHVWPAWMRSYLPPGQASQFVRISNFNNGTPLIHPGPLNRKGDGRSQKLKVICTPCNNNWMSVLQDRTKDVLLPLLLKDTLQINPQNHELLATWATMFTMVYETTQPNHAQNATTSQQRALFKIEQKPPQYWMFWCAPHDGRSSPAFQTAFGSVRRPGDPVTVEPGKGSLTTCGPGGICFAIFGGNVEYGFLAFSQLITQLVEHFGFIRLWPTPGCDINVLDRRRSPLTSGDLEALHHELRDFLEKEVAIGRQCNSSPDRNNR